jgi:hypothetical protein
MVSEKDQLSQLLRKGRHKHQKKIMTFFGDQKEDIVNLMEVNIE